MACDILGTPGVAYWSASLAGRLRSCLKLMNINELDKYYIL